MIEMRDVQDAVWKPVVGYEGLYEVSDQGEVRSLDREVEGRNWKCDHYTYIKRGGLIKPHLKSSGYLQVSLYKDGKPRSIAVHRLVAEAFLGHSDLTVNHINEDKTDNRLSNLEYMTIAENVRYSSAVKVESFDLDTLETIKIYDAMIDVAKDGFDVGAVNNCVLGKPRFNSHLGVGWRKCGEEGMTISKQRDIGTRFETACVKYMRSMLDDDRIERRALHGRNDMGDIFNLYVHGYEGIIECKCYKSFGPSNLKKWKEQMVDERNNAGVDFALLVVHEPGVGNASFGRNSCYMQIRDLDKIQNHTSFLRDPSETFINTWIRMDLETACEIMKGLNRD